MAEQAEEKQGWVSVHERLPEPGETVLIWLHGGPDVAWLGLATDQQKAWCHDYWDTRIPVADGIITHWHPLPPPPDPEAPCPTP